MHYIIGSGVAASIAKKIFPEYKIIAPAGAEFLSIQEVWETPETIYFAKKYIGKYKSKIFTNSIIGDELELYNKLTRKPKDSVPSANKTEIPILAMEIGNVAPEIKERVVEIMHDKIKTNKQEYEYEKIILCSPITFKILGQEPVEYEPIYFYEIVLDDPFFETDYCYLFERKYLEEGIYRICRKVANIFIIESKKELNEEKIKKIFKTEYVLGKHKNPFGNFLTRELQLSKEIIPVSRNSKLNKEYLLSDTIKDLLNLKGELLL